MGLEKGQGQYVKSCIGFLMGKLGHLSMCVQEKAGDFSSHDYTV